MSITGLSNAKTDHKVITEVVQDGDKFTWTQSIPNWTWSNSFTVGEECELKTMTGANFRVSLYWFIRCPLNTRPKYLTQI